MTTIARCPHGHEYTPENTRFSGGRRYCRTCKADRARRRKRAVAGIPLDAPPLIRPRGSPSCAKGHALDDANTYVRPDGCRICRACRREQFRAWRARTVRPSPRQPGEE